MFFCKKNRLSNGGNVWKKCTKTQEWCETLASQLASYVFVFHVLGSLYALVIQLQKETVNSKLYKITLWANTIQKTKCCATLRLESEHGSGRTKPSQASNSAPTRVQVLPAVSQEI